ncbi:DUF6362 family protein [Hahella sp. HN01]|uniref:DUF6362 family protein n=1 Tax=Hahella sp. HN01 TaxID=2847262 RepID=UPI001C1EE202|nr:DUF6362 family protein [Hahella sp. HN01]MBU6955507.1 helix-turn-helix domain-containing protein [Hahella sp. HN01]
MTEWTLERVADRFTDAAITAQRLPPVRVRGYANSWPAILRKPWENMGAEPVVRRLPPDPAAIDRMLETFRWVKWLTEDQRHLVWMRADGCPWKEVCAHFGMDRTTGWRRWKAALSAVAVRLNDPEERISYK